MSLPAGAQPNPLDVALGQRVRDRRKSLRISQTELAEGIGVSFQQVQKYERGANRMSFSTLVLVARRLDCSAAELIDGLDGSGPLRPSARPALSPQETELLGAFAAIAAEPLRFSALELIKQMAAAFPAGGPGQKPA